MTEQSVTATFKQGDYECVVVITDNPSKHQASVRWKFSNKPKNYKDTLLTYVAGFFIDKLKEHTK